MRIQPDHIAIARGYWRCADEHVSFAERARNDGDRNYHLGIAREYLLLAEDELKRLCSHSVNDLNRVIGNAR